MFRIWPSIAYEPPHVDDAPIDVSLIREFKVAAMKAVLAMRAIPRSAPPEAFFKVGAIMLMRRDKNPEGTKLLVQDWSGPFKVKNSIILGTYSNRRVRESRASQFTLDDFVGMCNATMDRSSVSHVATEATQMRRSKNRLIVVVGYE